VSTLLFAALDGLIKESGSKGISFNEVLESDKWDTERKSQIEKWLKEDLRFWKDKDGFIRIKVGEK
jgi:hypothetical protein